MKCSRSFSPMRLPCLRLTLILHSKVLLTKFMLCERLNYLRRRRLLRLMRCLRGRMSRWLILPAEYMTLLVRNLYSNFWLSVISRLHYQVTRSFANIWPCHNVRKKLLMKLYELWSSQLADMQERRWHGFEINFFLWYMLPTLMDWSHRLICWMHLVIMNISLAVLWADATWWPLIDKTKWKSNVQDVGLQIAEGANTRLRFNSLTEPRLWRFSCRT